MIRTALLTALTLVGIALTAGDASAQFRRGGRGGSGGGYISPSYGYGNGYGNSYYGNTAPGITIPGTGITISGSNYGSSYGSPYYGGNYGNSYGNYGSQYQRGFRGNSYYNTVPYNTVPYYTTPETTTSLYTPSDTSQIATLNVQLPTSDAQLWLNDTFTTSPTGMDRQFQSPPLDPAKNYSYTVKIRWTDDGKVMEKTKDVKVEPGKTSTVSFR
jgi:uncharacterized protein (TIGR03000 family)